MTILSTARAVSLAAAIAFSAVGSARGQFFLTGYAAGTGGSRVYGLSADGRIAAGASINSPAGPGFTWTSAGGRNDFGLESGMPTTTTAYAISGDGATVTGSAFTGSGEPRAFRYRGPGTFQTLGTIGNFAVSAGNGTSGDGSVVVGQAKDANDFSSIAFRWTQAGGMQALGFARSGDFYSSARDISQDGRTIVGFSSGSNAAAFSWTQDTGFRILQGFAGGGSNAEAVNANGTIICGSSDGTSTLARAVVWRDGVMQNLGARSDMVRTVADSLSDDGLVVVGRADLTNFTTQATIWTPGTGMILFSEYLVANGVSIPQGWFCGSCVVSADGRTFAGIGASSTIHAQGFVVTVPAPSAVVALSVSLGLAVVRRRRDE